MLSTQIAGQLISTLIQFAKSYVLAAGDQRHCIRRKSDLFFEKFMNALFSRKLSNSVIPFVNDLPLLCFSHKR